MYPERDRLVNALLEMVQNGGCEERYAECVYDAVDMLNAQKCTMISGDEYVRLDDIHAFPIRKDHHDKENGNEHFIFGIESVMEYIEWLPKYKPKDRDRQDAIDAITEGMVHFTNSYDGQRWSWLTDEEHAKVDNILTIGAGISTGYCPACGDLLDENHNASFCGNCGKAVRWQ